MRTGDIVQKIPVNGTPPMAAGFEGGDSTGQRVQISGDEGARDGVVFFRSVENALIRAATAKTRRVRVRWIYARNDPLYCLCLPARAAP